MVANDSFVSGRGKRKAMYLENGTRLAKRALVRVPPPRNNKSKLLVKAVSRELFERELLNFRSIDETILLHQLLRGEAMGGETRLPRVSDAPRKFCRFLESLLFRHYT